jgi:predicted peroxiredoxin
MVMSYEGPDSLDGGVALFFRLEGCTLVKQKEKKEGCVLCARGYVRGAWEDKIRLRLSSGSRFATGEMKVKRGARGCVFALSSSCLLNL